MKYSQKLILWTQFGGLRFEMADFVPPVFTDEELKETEEKAAEEKAAEELKASELKAKEAAEAAKIKESEPAKKKTASESRIDELNGLIQGCLKDYLGLESNIPINHMYWGWLNELRSLMNAPK